jgi:hypothetical protein
MKAQKSRQSSNYLPFAENGNSTSSSSLSYSNSTPTGAATATSNGTGESQQTTNTNVTTRRAQSLSSSASPIPFQLPDPIGGDSRSSQQLGGDPVVRVEVPRSIRSAPGAQLLSELELELCFKTQLFPLQYVAILEAVVRYSRPRLLFGSSNSFFSGKAIAMDPSLRRGSTE